MLIKTNNRRFDILAILVILVFLILVGRMVYLQIVEGKYYSKLADGNRIRLVPIMAPRGIFYDRNHKELVTNRPGFTVSLVPLKAPVSDEVIQRLSGILGMPEAEIRKKIATHSGNFDPIRIKTDVGADIVTRVEENKASLPGVVVEIQPIRNYIYQNLAAHLFGYVNEINDTELQKLKPEGYKEGDIVGKAGLERVYDKQLRGVNGGSQVEVDASGRPVQDMGKKETVPGDALVLTLDLDIQKTAEEAMDAQLKYLREEMHKNAYAAAAVAMNPQTGEILAMVSRPAYNPNAFATGISEKNWKIIHDNPYNPMDDKVISGEYPPGSTFKVITGIAALELGKVTPEEKIFDAGHHWIIPKGNAEGEALGWINFEEALSKSDNVYFYEMGNRLGIDNLEKYAKAFGLGKATGIKLPGESEGLVASRAYKEKVYNEDWYLSETFDAAIGQGFQLATPLQVAMVYSEIANGGKRYRPYVVQKIIGPGGKVLAEFQPELMGEVKINPQVLSLVRASLHDVTKPGGTAGDVFANFPIPVAGKTGTAENAGDDHGWFVAYAPYDNPTIVVAVIVQHGGFGTSSAAPIAEKILAAAFHLTKQAPPAEPVNPPAPQDG